MSNVDHKTVVSYVLPAMAALAVWIIDDMRDQMKETVSTVQEIKTDVALIKHSQQIDKKRYTDAMQNMKDDLQRVNDKLDLTILADVELYKGNDDA